MGQYYKPINLTKKEYIYTHDIKEGYSPFGVGLKLMEHSWIGNPLMNAVENLIKRGGRWFGDKIVWAGDYADNEPNKRTNLYSIMEREGVRIVPLVPKKEVKYNYLVNLDKKEYVVMSKIPKDDNGWMIHPLPLLTCEGNGNGGGDYFDEDKNNIIGSWARCRVVALNKLPNDGEYKEIEFDLVEKRIRL